MQRQGGNTTQLLTTLPGDVFLQFFHGYVDLGFPVLDLRKVRPR